MEMPAVTPRQADLRLVLAAEYHTVAAAVQHEAAVVQLEVVVAAAEEQHGVVVVAAANIANRSRAASSGTAIHLETNSGGANLLRRFICKSPANSSPTSLDESYKPSLS